MLTMTRLLDNLLKLEHHTVF